MKLYRQRPVTVETEQFDGTAQGIDVILDFICPHLSRELKTRVDYWRQATPNVTWTLQVPTKDGEQFAVAGDYIVRVADDEFEVLTADKFAHRFEEV